jgi:hypothetical protein
LHVTEDDRGRADLPQDFDLAATDSQRAVAYIALPEQDVPLLKRCCVVMPEPPTETTLLFVIEACGQNEHVAAAGGSPPVRPPTLP